MSIAVMSMMKCVAAVVTVAFTIPVTFPVPITLTVPVPGPIPVPVTTVTTTAVGVVVVAVAAVFCAVRGVCRRRAGRVVESVILVLFFFAEISLFGCFLAVHTGLGGHVQVLLFRYLHELEGWQERGFRLRRRLVGLVVVLGLGDICRVIARGRERVVLN